MQKKSNLIMKKIKRLPDQPGVYFFKRGRRILYIGKATSLRERVKSYFGVDIFETRGLAIERMVGEASSVDFIPTDSVLEALILEANLIKKHRPKYNVREKDDKSWNFVIITKEMFPRVLVVRGKELSRWSAEVKYQFGPYPAGGELREALRIVRKIFPFRDRCIPFGTDGNFAALPFPAKGGVGPTRTKFLVRSSGSSKPCFDAQIGLCPGVCSGAISASDYGKIINNIRLFFEGRKSRLVSGLRRQMKQASGRQDFEEAAKIRNQIFSLEHINDVALLKRETRATGFRIEAFDVAHIAGTFGVGVLVVVENGKLAKESYKKFRLRGVSAGKSDDIGNLKEILERRFRHSEWPFPDLVVVDGAVAQKNIAERVLNEMKIDIPVAAVTKDERHKAKNIIGEQRLVHDYHKEILLANAEAHRAALRYHRGLRDRVS